MKIGDKLIGPCNAHATVVAEGLSTFFAKETSGHIFEIDDNLWKLRIEYKPNTPYWWCGDDHRDYVELILDCGNGRGEIIDIDGKKRVIVLSDLKPVDISNKRNIPLLENKALIGFKTAGLNIDWWKVDVSTRMTWRKAAYAILYTVV